MEWLVFIAIYGGLFFLLYKVAKSKNRDPTGWIIVSILISPIIILIILLFMQKLPKQRNNNQRRRSKKLTKKKRSRK